MLRKSSSEDSPLRDVEERIREETELLQAAQNEQRESKLREDELRKEVGNLKVKLAELGKISADEIAKLKDTLKDASDDAVTTAASEIDSVVNKYERQITELQKTKDKTTLDAVAKLMAEEQKKLVAAVAQLTAERDQALNAAEKKYFEELAHITRKFTKMRDEESKNLSELLSKLSTLEADREQLQLDANAWKDQVEAYEERIKRLETERDDILSRLKSSEAESAANQEAAAKGEELVKAVTKKSREDNDEAVAMVAEILRKMAKLEEELVVRQLDRDNWKGNAVAAEEQVESLRNEREDLLLQLNRAEANESRLTEKEVELVRILAEKNTEVQTLVKKYEDDLQCAIAALMAEKTLAYNEEVQAAVLRAKEAEALVDSLRRDFDKSVRDSSKSLVKELKSRERDLERQLKKARQDYTAQARKMEEIQLRLDTVTSEYNEAKAKWERSMTIMKQDFERRAQADKVTLDEKIAFYEERTKVLSEELKLVKSQASAPQKAVPAPTTTVVKRPLFEFNKGKVAEAQARADDAERQLLAATSEMEALRVQLLEAEERAKAAKLAAKESAKSTKKPNFFDQLFSVMKNKRVQDVEMRLNEIERAKDAQLNQLKESYEQKIVDLQSSTASDDKARALQTESSKVKALERELEAAAKKLSALQTASQAEIAAVKKAASEEYDAKLKALQAKVTSLEDQLANASKVASEQMEAAKKAAKSERDSMEKSLREELAAAKKLAEDAERAAKRELVAALRDVELQAKNDLREQAKRLAEERSKSEARIRETSKMATDKLKERIANFEKMLDEREADIEARFNAQFYKLVVDFRREVEKLQRQIRDAEARADEIAASKPSQAQAPQVI